MTPQIAEFAILRDRLFEDFFPFWLDAGVDWQGGGFYERLAPDGAILPDARRARLVGRQIFAAAVAERLGWAGPARAALEHGVRYLLERTINDGRVTPLISPAGEPLSQAFDLYDQAFVLFGLAAAAGRGVQVDALTAHARAIRDHMLAGWKHPVAGFEESNPRTLPLKANPHMHMLEASLAWSAVDSDPAWGQLADEIVELCLSRFLSPETGALHEYFDGDWNMLTDGDQGVVEPGHQFEWAWLLIRWGRSRNRPDALAAARRLIAVAEGPGVSRLHMAINELNTDLSVRDARHRLWPQTERIKAFVALQAIEDDAGDRQAAMEKTSEAALGLLRFFDHPVEGAWWEHIEPGGDFAHEPTRGSSLYHITCAVQEMAGLSD
jgi:mannose/cellobiose epimerase-like protein (N-acyl-D-glucosamine 2-epimerase family)